MRVCEEVLLALFGAILAQKSLRLTLLLLTCVDAAMALTFVALALPLVRGRGRARCEALRAVVGAVRVSVGRLRCFQACAYVYRNIPIQA